MNILRRFGIISEQEKKDIKEQGLLFDQIISRHSRLSREIEYERTRRSDGKCPKCSSSIIVNKIQDINGSLSGSFSLGYGRVSGSVGTSDVNHCNSCGNQWKKYKTNCKWPSDIVKTLFYYLYWIDKGDKSYSKQELIVDLINSGIRQETIESKHDSRDHMSLGKSYKSLFPKYPGHQKNK